MDMNDGKQQEQLDAICLLRKQWQRYSRPFDSNNMHRANQELEDMLTALDVRNQKCRFLRSASILMARVGGGTRSKRFAERIQMIRRGNFISTHRIQTQFDGSPF